MENGNILIRLFCLSVTSVENTAYLSKVSIFVVFHISEIPWHPASIDQDATRLIIFIEVRVKRCDDLDATFVIFLLFDENLLVDIQVPFQRDGLHVPLFLELSIILPTPWEEAAVLWRDVNWVLHQ